MNIPNIVFFFGRIGFVYWPRFVSEIMGFTVGRMENGTVFFIGASQFNLYHEDSADLVCDNGNVLSLSTKLVLPLGEIRAI